MLEEIKQIMASPSNSFCKKRTKNTNVIILELPHCFDLEHFSRVNKEVTAYNRKLHKVAKTFKHVQIQNMSGDRRHFTNYSFHMNSSGKAWICQEIVKRIQDLFGRVFEYNYSFELEGTTVNAS
jgi:hypothetical protein